MAKPYKLFLLQIQRNRFSLLYSFSESSISIAGTNSVCSSVNALQRQCMPLSAVFLIYKQQMERHFDIHEF